MFVIADMIEDLSRLSQSERIAAINNIREALHNISPFRDEPVDFVRWVKADAVEANDYNPNSVAPPEMELLRVSIEADGYTQPIVANSEGGKYVVVDGFHRHRVGRECLAVAARIKGYLPVVQIRESQTDRSDRIASTIRHNRARGKHRIEGMSDIVIELKRRNWSNERIAKNLGMDDDEVLRLCQITGLSEIFADQDFSKSWDVEGEITEADFRELSDDVTTYGDEVNEFRTVNTSDEGRVFHTYEHWECYRAGFYNTTKDDMTKEQCEVAYAEFLRDLGAFEISLKVVTTEWKHSCEHYLTNAAMNRIAWLGQASVCHARGIPSTYRSGFQLLSPAEQERANNVALVWLNKWMVANDRDPLTMDEAYSGRQSDIY